MPNPTGFDISSNNGLIDWPTLAAHVLPSNPDAFPIIKVSQGDWYVNPLLDQQRDGAHAAGFRNVGLYHYFEAVASGGPSLDRPLSGAQNAEFFLKAIGDHGGLLTREFLAVDWESDYKLAPDADLSAAQTDLIGTLTRALGLQIVEYSAPYYMMPHKLTIPTSRYWAALPVGPPPNCLIWQYSWKGNLPGINGDVDLNALRGPISTLQPFQWGLQPDPVAGKPATQPDIDGDVPTILKHVLTLTDLDLIHADVSLALTKFGLLP